MYWPSHILWLFNFVAIGENLCFCFLLPTIVWDPRNPMFACDDLEILVKLSDKINFVCPHKALNQGELVDPATSSNLYENAHILQPEQRKNFYMCDATGAVRVLHCNTPNNVIYRTLTFKQFSGGNALTFQPGKTYYLIGTGYRTISQLNNRINGSCAKSNPQDGPFKLRLKIRICTNDEVKKYRNCSVCKKSGCYCKGLTSTTKKPFLPGTKALTSASKTPSPMRTVVEQQRQDNKIKSINYILVGILALSIVIIVSLIIVVLYMKRTFARRIEREVKISPNKGNSQKEMYTDITPYSDNGMSYQSFQINPVASNYESKIVQLGVQPTAGVVQNQGTDQDNQLCKDVAVTGDLNYTKLSPPPNIEGSYPSFDPGKPAYENV